MTFTADPAERPIDFVGNVRLHATTISPRAGCHLVAKLVDVRPDGYASLIVEGAMALGGGDSTAQLDLGPLAYRLRSGHHLRLELAGSNYPRYAVHPGTTQCPLNGHEAASPRIGVIVGGRGGAFVEAREALPPSGG